jgi:hypothetical protein
MVVLMILIDLNFLISQSKRSEINSQIETESGSWVGKRD